jgi:hypothetical protein
MLAEWANLLAILVAGFAVGVLAVIVNIVTPRAFRDAAHDWKPGEGLFAGLRRRAEEQAEVIEVGPKAFRLASQAFAGTIAAIVLTIWLSPVEMEWWPFLGAGAVGAAAGYTAFAIARRNPPSEAPIGAAAEAGGEEGKPQPA